MGKLKKSWLSIALMGALIIGMMSDIPVNAKGTKLSEEQNNAIDMLNYIAVLAQEINASENGRVYMEEAYSILQNNMYPNAVDSGTLAQMTGLLDTVGNYRMMDVKRERIQYIYEQSQAQKIRSAVPDSSELVSAVRSFSPVKLAGYVAYAPVDSHSSYTAYTAESERQYLEEGWALEEGAVNALHESLKDIFSYMVKMSNDDKLPADLLLTEDRVHEFVSWKNNGNIAGRIQFLESNKSTYQSYGGYWLTLAESYYSNGDYEKCLDAVSAYEDMGIQIFRRDYGLAKVLPLAIASAKEMYKINKYASYASERAQAIVDNTDYDDWALKYFAAQTFVDLYAETQDAVYLQNAYNITLDSVNYLVSEQQSLNAGYLAALREKAVPKDADMDEKTQIADYNIMLKETRKTEMPPVYEPLTLLCDLLFAISDEIGIDESEKSRVEKILHPNGERLFLSEVMDGQYWFDKIYTPAASENIDIEFGGTAMSLPVEYLTKDTAISVTVTGPGDSAPTVLKDWQIDEVDRGTEGDISTYNAVFTSKEAKEYFWETDETIIIDITPKEGIDASYHFEYKAVGTKDTWYDYLKVWENRVNFRRQAPS